jgi:predicted nucleic acid-binding protein
MASADAEAVFLDTNVLVHANVAESPLHQIALTAIQKRYDAGVELWVSRQVLREYLAVLSRPQTFSAPQPMSTLSERVRYFAERFRVADEGADVTEHLLAVLERIPVGGSQVHDANIVATMQAYGIKQLLTDNTDDFARFSEIVTVLSLDAPFEPAETDNDG